LLTDFTKAGVTSVVGLLGTDDVTRSTAELLAGVRALRELGLSAWCWTGGYHLPPTTLTGTVRSDIVNIDAIIGAGEIAVSDHRSSQPTLEELLRIASECHVAGLLTKKAGVMHLHLGDGSRGLELIRAALDTAELPARVFQPTHVNRRKALFEEALDLAGRGCHIDITSFPVGPEEDAYSAEVALKRYFDANLPPELVSISSDGGGCLPVFDDQGQMTSMDIGKSSSLPETLHAAVELGVPFDFALAAFTSNIADHLRLEGKGHIRPGASADLVALDSGGAVVHVLAGGTWMICDGAPLQRGPFE
jgi:beta-aspartyl-dipeptidase (metallo-type)